MTTNIQDLASKLTFYTPPAVPASSSWFKAPETSSSDLESAGLMSWASTKLSSAKSTVDELSNTKERFTTFAILAICGTVCMILAFTFLPIVIISPHKFALLFTMGSALMLASFSFLRGHMAFFSHLASVSRLPFSLCYGLSLVGTLYCSLVMNSYVLTLVFSIVQVVALCYFLVSYIPGGTSALSFVGTMVGSSVKSVFVK